MKFKPLNIIKMMLVLILLTEVKIIFDLSSDLFYVTCFLIGIFAIRLNIAPFMPQTDEEP